VEDLSMPIEIIAVETVREASGLALSSRNNYLNKEEKNIAPALSRNLKWLAQAIPSNDDFVGLAQKAARNINMAGMKTDYIHICHARTLQPASKDDKELVILAAAHCGKARLIDNLQVTLA
jgi:pantoate--beta-alanine ligase